MSIFWSVYQLSAHSGIYVTQFIVLESMVPLIAWHSAQTYPTLTAPVLSASSHLSVRDQNKRRNLADHQRATALVWTTSTPATPSLSGKGSKWSLVCALWTLSPCARGTSRCKDVPGEARLLDDRFDSSSIAHLLCYCLQHFWSRIEVLHV